MLTNFCSAETLPLPTFSAIGSMLLRLGADHQPFDVVVGVVLGLLLAEEGSKSLVKLDQSFGRGAHFVLGHGGSLQNVA